MAILASRAAKEITAQQGNIALGIIVGAELNIATKLSLAINLDNVADFEHDILFYLPIPYSLFTQTDSFSSQASRTPPGC